MDIWTKRIILVVIAVGGMAFLQRQLEPKEIGRTSEASDPSSTASFAGSASGAPNSPTIPSGWIFWSNEREGFGAFFPGTPERVHVSSSAEEGYGYVFAQGEGDLSGSTYTIMVTPLPGQITPDIYGRYLEARHSRYAQMTSHPDSSQVWWSKFGNSSQRLNYEFKYEQGGQYGIATGFWVIDRGRSIKVGVTYVESMAQPSIAEVTKFPESFFLASSDK